MKNRAKRNFQKKTYFCADFWSECGFGERQFPCRADNLGTRCESVAVPTAVILVLTGIKGHCTASVSGGLCEKAFRGEISQKTSQRSWISFAFGIEVEDRVLGFSAGRFQLTFFSLFLGRKSIWILTFQPHENRYRFTHMFSHVCPDSRRPCDSLAGWRRYL